MVVIVEVFSYIFGADCVSICRRGLILFLFTLHSRRSSFIASIPEWRWHGMWQLQRLNSQDVSYHFASRASSASVTVPKDSFNLTDRIVSASAKLLYFHMCPNVSNCLSLGTPTTGHVKWRFLQWKKAEMYCNHMSVNTSQTYSLSYFIGKSYSI